MAQLVAALITVHGLLSFLLDVYGLFDPSGKTLCRSLSLETSWSHGSLGLRGRWEQICYVLLNLMWSSKQHVKVFIAGTLSVTICHWCAAMSRIHPASSYNICNMHRTTCLENLEMSWNLTAVRDFTKSQGKNLVMEKWSKTVYCWLHICVHSWLCWVCAFHFAFRSCTVVFLPPLLTITLVPAWYE